MESAIHRQPSRDMGDGYMAGDVGDWKSFWDVSSPEEAAGTLRELYGVATAEAASKCAVAAQCDGRDEDYRFWIATLAELNGDWANRERQGAASVAMATFDPEHDKATHIGLLFDHSPEGLRTADELAATFPAINERLVPSSIDGQILCLFPRNGAAAPGRVHDRA
jgi:hypothetical protein